MLRNRRPTLAALAAVLAGAWLLAAAPPANAGCGCDHPPPAWAPVMPPFAPPGKEVRISAAEIPFSVGETYTVYFGSRDADVEVVAESSTSVKVVVPDHTPVGPTGIRVRGPEGIMLTLGPDGGAFTTLSPLPVVPSHGEALAAQEYEAAVAADGTLLLTLNVRHVLEPMQFAVQLLDLPLEFSAEDVVFYNVDGFDLTLFTLDVSDPTQRQWGEYHGWDVAEDGDLIGTVYDRKVRKADDEEGHKSDVLTYWRHEFHTYTDAHLPGGEFELDDEGLHPDGTVHVNHGHLTLAISGLRRNPLDPSNLQPLSPGAVEVDVAVLTVEAENPVESALMAAQLEAIDHFEDLGDPEPHFDEFLGMDPEPHLDVFLGTALSVD